MKRPSKAIRQLALALTVLSLAYVPGCSPRMDPDPQQHLRFQNFSALLPQGGGKWILNQSTSTETKKGVVVRVSFKKHLEDHVIVASITEAPFTAYLDVPEGYSPSEREEITLSQRQRLVLEDLKASLQEDVETVPGELVSSIFETDASPELACQRHYVTHDSTTIIEGVHTTARLWVRGISCFPPDLRVLAELTYVKAVKTDTVKMGNREEGDEFINEAETFFRSLDWGVRE